MGKKSCIWLTTAVSLLVLTSLSGAKTTKVEAKAQMDVQTILEKVRKAQRPCENMRIEWAAESPGSGRYRGSAPPPEKRIRLTKYKGSAVLSGVRSRIEERQETYYGENINEPGNIQDKTYVFDGTQQRQLKRRTKGLRSRKSSAGLWLTSVNSQLLRKRLYGGLRPPIHNEERLKEYKLTLTQGEKPGRFILDASAPKAGLYRLTIDADRGYNVIKQECLRSDGSKAYEYNFKLKRYRDGIWFVSEWERVRFGRKEGAKPRIEEKVTITNVEFDIPSVDEGMFRLQFPEGATVADTTWNYRYHTDFLVGCLSEAKHTQEDSAVTAILAGEAGKQKTSGEDEVFGAAKECVISSIGHRKDCFIDFDTGALLSVPEDFHSNSKPEKWLEENSVDARVETDDGLCGLWTFNTVLIPVSNDRWDSITPAACHKVFAKVKGIYPPIMSAEGKLPATFLFQTWDGRGILQILEVQRDTQPRSIKVRYKIIQEATQANAFGESQKEMVKKILSYEGKYGTSIIKFTRITYGKSEKAKEYVPIAAAIEYIVSSKGRFHRADLAWVDQDNGTKEGERKISDGERFSWWRFSNRDKRGSASTEVHTEQTDWPFPTRYFRPFTYYGGNNSDVSLSVESGEDGLIHMRWKSKTRLDIEATSRPEQDSLLPVEYVSSHPLKGGRIEISEQARYEYRGPVLKKITADYPPHEIRDTYSITDVNFSPRFAGGHFDITFPEGTPVRDVILDVECPFGRLRDAKHTQEDSAVTKILDSKGASTNEVFGPVSERAINSMGHRKDCFIDLDRGKLFSITDDLRPDVEPGPRPWLQKRSIDAAAKTEKGLCGLWTINTVVVPVSNKRWESITPAACHKVLEKLEGIYPPIMSAEGKLPATFLFQTYDNRGILQILEVRKDAQPRSIKVRYKMLQEIARP